MCLFGQMWHRKEHMGLWPVVEWSWTGSAFALLSLANNLLPSHAPRIEFFTKGCLYLSITMGQTRICLSGSSQAHLWTGKCDALIGQAWVTCLPTVHSGLEATITHPRESLQKHRHCLCRTMWIFFLESCYYLAFEDWSTKRLIRFPQII